MTREQFGPLTPDEMKNQAREQLHQILSSNDYLSQPDADKKYVYLANAFVDAVNKTRNSEELSVVLDLWNDLIFNYGIPKLTFTPYQSEQMLDEHKERLKSAKDNNSLFAAFDHLDSLTLSPEVHRSKKAATQASLDATLRHVHLNEEKKEAMMPVVQRIIRRILRLAPSTNHLYEDEKTD